MQNLYPKIFESSHLLPEASNIFKNGGYNNGGTKHQRILLDLPPKHFVSCLMFVVSPFKDTVSNVYIFEFIFP